jgi:metal-responsive CopG/Arc/MetJ family transcriptional regulator
MAIDRTERFGLSVSSDLLVKIDEWRERQRDLPSRAEAIRRLIEVGLRAENETRGHPAFGKRPE